MRPQHYPSPIITLILAAAALVAFVGSTFLPRQASRPLEDCTGPGEYACHVRNVKRIIAEDGIAPAIAYADTIGRETLAYPMLHMLLHVIGHAAYDAAGTIPSALAFVPPEQRAAPEYFFDFNGYQHGVFRGFFHARAGEPTDRLVRESCGEYFGVTPVPDDSDPEGLAPFQCFHSVGHAIMYNRDNDVMRSLTDCRALPQAWMAGWCSLGVFMENYYLYLPWYEPGRPRPDVIAPSMAPLCSAAAGAERLHCSRYVGLSRFAADHDFGPALAECLALAEEYRRPCVTRLARIEIPQRHATDVQAMQGVCRLAGPEEGACLEAVAVGIRQGGAGAERKQTPFCDSLPLRHRASCHAALQQIFRIMY